MEKMYTITFRENALKNLEQISFLYNKEIQEIIKDALGLYVEFIKHEAQECEVQIYNPSNSQRIVYSLIKKEVK